MYINLKLIPAMLSLPSMDHVSLHSTLLSGVNIFEQVISITGKGHVSLTGKQRLLEIDSANVHNDEPGNIHPPWSCHEPSPSRDVTYDSNLRVSGILNAYITSVKKCSSFTVHTASQYRK